jgi:hypothetical protein
MSCGETGLRSGDFMVLRMDALLYFDIFLYVKIVNQWHFIAREQMLFKIKLQSFLIIFNGTKLHNLLRFLEQE